MVKIHLSNQDLLALKLTFFLFLEENICCGYSLEAPQWGASSKYPQHVFFEKYISLNLDTLLARAMKSLSQEK